VVGVGTQVPDILALHPPGGLTQSALRVVSDRIARPLHGLRDPRDLTQILRHPKRNFRIQGESPNSNLFCGLSSGQMQPALPHSSGRYFAFRCLYSTGIPTLSDDLQVNPRHVAAKLRTSTCRIWEAPVLLQPSNGVNDLQCGQMRPQSSQKSVRNELSAKFQSDHLVLE